MGVLRFRLSRLSLFETKEANHRPQQLSPRRRSPRAHHDCRGRRSRMNWRQRLLLKLCCSLCPLAAVVITSHPLPPLTNLDRSARHTPTALPSRPLSRQRSCLGSLVASQGSSSDDGEPFSIQPIYLLLATAETIFWYWLAPGIDPASRWLAPVLTRTPRSLRTVHVRTGYACQPPACCTYHVP